MRARKEKSSILFKSKLPTCLFTCNKKEKKIKKILKI